MKKTQILLAAAILSATSIHAQVWNDPTSGMPTTGVGTTTNGSVNIKGGILNMFMPGDPGFRNISAGSSQYGLSLNANTNAGWDGGRIELNGESSAIGRPGSIFFFSKSFGPSTTNGFEYYNYTGSTFNQLMQIANDGKVKISNTLHVQGGMLDLGVAGDPGFTHVSGNSNSWGLDLNANNGGVWDGAKISLFGPTSSRPGAVCAFSYGPGASSNYGHQFYNFDPSGASFTMAMGIQHNGKVVIGQSLLWASTPVTPNGYKLYVAEGILTEKLKVANSTDLANWADFVFNKDYDLMPLSEVETYVKQNKHLPEIPSAAEVMKDGIDVASMDSKLLQKIEELTLYVIEQQKQIDDLKKRKK